MRLPYAANSAARPTYSALSKQSAPHTRAPDHRNALTTETHRVTGQRTLPHKKDVPTTHPARLDAARSAPAPPRGDTPSASSPSSPCKPRARRRPEPSLREGVARSLGADMPRPQAGIGTRRAASDETPYERPRAQKRPKSLRRAARQERVPWQSPALPVAAQRYAHVRASHCDTTLRSVRALAISQSAWNLFLFHALLRRANPRDHPATEAPRYVGHHKARAHFGSPSVQERAWMKITLRHEPLRRSYESAPIFLEASGREDVLPISMRQPTEVGKMWSIIAAKNCRFDQFPAGSELETCPESARRLEPRKLRPMLIKIRPNW